MSSSPEAEWRVRASVRIGAAYSLMNSILRRALHTVTIGKDLMFSRLPMSAVSPRQTFQGIQTSRGHLSHVRTYLLPVLVLASKAIVLARFGHFGD
jgi:hypothetical protein